MQLTLFETARETLTEPVVPPGIPGLIYAPGFLNSAEELELLREIDARPWLTDLQRRVQHYGYRYVYRARRVDVQMRLGPLPAFVVFVAERLVASGLMSELPDQMIVNEYQPGQGIAPHVDCEPCFGDHIVTVSLGWAYEMEFRSLAEDQSFAILLQRGSALTMSGPARFDWTHGIRPRKSDHGMPRQRRVSLTFRTVILDE